MFFDSRDNSFNYLNEENEFEFDTDNISQEYEYEENKNNIYEANNNYIFNYYRPSDKLSNIEDGFLRGNMFNDIYDGYYKRIKRIRTSNEREKLLLKIQMLTFSSLDLGLYLDIYPDDKEVLEKFKKYNNELDSLTKEYERIYGPLKSECDKDGNKYKWINNPWPWSLGGNK